MLTKYLMIWRHPMSPPENTPRAALRAKVTARAKAKTAPAGAEPVSVSSVVDWIRERIRRGRLVPGQRLVEADIMRELAASRSRVREALQREIGRASCRERVSKQV